MILRPEESMRERRRRILLEGRARRASRTRYAIQINLAGPHDNRIYPKVWLPFLFSTEDEAWNYMHEVNPMKFFAAGRSASIEWVRLAQG